MASVAHLKCSLQDSAARWAVFNLKTLAFGQLPCPCVEAVLVSELTLPEGIPAA